MTNHTEITEAMLSPEFARTLVEASGVAIAKQFLTQPKEMAWEERCDQLARVAVAAVRECLDTHAALQASTSPPAEPSAGVAAENERLREQRESYIASCVADGAILRDVRAWLKQCHDWLLETDLDMTCPMRVDPLDLIARIDRSFGQPALTKGSPNHAG